MTVTKADIEWCWSQAKTVRGQNPSIWRRDEMGNLIYKPSYGTRGTYGWHIDHRKPKALNGTDHRRNLRVLYWKANLIKGKKY